MPGIPEFATPQHKLERVRLFVVFLPSGETNYAIAGESSTKRSNLWTLNGSLDADEAPAVLVDHVEHALSVIVTDRPNTQARLSFGLAGGLSREPTLPW